MPSLVIKSVPLAVKNKRIVDKNESPSVRLALEAHRKQKGDVIHTYYVWHKLNKVAFRKASDATTEI